MKIINKIALSTTLLMLALTPSLSLAGYKSDIIQSCTAYQQGRDSNEINACKLYIDGFIDALLYAEEGTVKPKDAMNTASSKQSDYEKRAFKTRLSSRSDTKNNPQFCLNSEHDRKSVASILAKSINIDALQNKPLKEVLFFTLTRKFPCQ